jgi:soluble lytic murein transglycosylase
VIERIVFAAALLALPATTALASDKDGTPVAMEVARDGDGIPDQLDAEQREGYRKAFAAIRDQRWSDVELVLAAMKPGPLHAVVRAELYTAKGSPKVELAPLMELLTQAPELPQAEQLARMAKSRGAIDTPLLPAQTRLIWFDAAPVRQRARSIKSDTAATEVALAIQPFVKADDGVGAEALVEKFAPSLTPDALTEWQQKVAWIYFTAGDDANARRVAEKAQNGVGDWVGQADWVAGLSAWRQQDCKAAGSAFERVATRAADT